MHRSDGKAGVEPVPEQHHEAESRQQLKSLGRLRPMRSIDTSREPGNEDAETIASGLAAAAHGGFTTVCAMPNTDPALDEPGVLARIRGAAAMSESPN